jgi:hypothetical protein
MPRMKNCPGLISWSIPYNFYPLYAEGEERVVKRSKDRVSHRVKDGSGYRPVAKACAV